MGPKAPHIFYILVAQPRPPDLFRTHDDRIMLPFYRKPLIGLPSRTLVRNFWSMIPAPGSNPPSKLPPSLCQRSTGRPIDGQTEISVSGGLQIWATCDARIYARPLALGGLGPRGELSFDWLSKVSNMFNVFKLSDKNMRPTSPSSIPNPPTPLAN